MASSKQLDGDTDTSPCCGDCFFVAIKQRSAQHRRSTNDSLDLSNVDAIRSLYKPLAPWQSRLLKLHPESNERSELAADLEPVDLVDADGVMLSATRQLVQYQALSYAWGEGKATTSVLIDGVRLPMTNQLESALLAYRAAAEDQYLWVDYVCINQLDSKEKGEQVARMMRIFQEAISVFAWLGNEADGSDLALEWMKHYQEFRHVLEIHKSSSIPRAAFNT